MISSARTVFLQDITLLSVKIHFHRNIFAKIDEKDILYDIERQIVLFIECTLQLGVFK